MNKGYQPLLSWDQVLVTTEQLIYPELLRPTTFCLCGSCIEDPMLQIFSTETTTAANSNITNIFDQIANEEMSFRADQINRPSSTIFLHWDKPQKGWFKINTDASWNKRRNLAGAGGVIRDYLGNWVAGFTTKIGECDVTSVLGAELWGILYGLRLAWDKGLRKVELETDSAISVSMIKKEDGVSDQDPLFYMLHSIQELKHRDWVCTITYIQRQKNMVADWLAKTSLDDDENYVVLEAQPADLHSLMSADSLGVSYPRVDKF